MSAIKAMRMRLYRRMGAAWTGRRRVRPAALLFREQELAADFDAALAVVLDDVGGGVGLDPVLGQERAGPDGVDRRVGQGHHAAFLGAEAGGGDDAHLGIAGAVELLA